MAKLQDMGVGRGPIIAAAVLIVGIGAVVGHALGWASFGRSPQVAPRPASPEDSGARREMKFWEAALGRVDAELRQAPKGPVRQSVQIERASVINHMRWAARRLPADAIPPALRPLLAVPPQPVASDEDADASDLGAPYAPPPATPDFGVPYAPPPPAAAVGAGAAPPSARAAPPAVPRAVGPLRSGLAPPAPLATPAPDAAGAGLAFDAPQPLPLIVYVERPRSHHARAARRPTSGKTAHGRTAHGKTARDKVAGR